MTQDQNKKTLRHFQCRDYLWEIFEQMSAELECSTDYLINEAMRQYARSRNYGTKSGASRPPTGNIPPLGNRPATAPPPPARAASHPGGVVPPPPPRAPLAPPAPAFQPAAAPQAQAAAPAYPQPMAAFTAPAPPRGATQPSNIAAAYPPVASQTGPGFGARGSMPPPLPSRGAPVQGEAPTLYVIFNGQKIPITKGEFVIGRGSKTADLAIKDGNISRRHAAIVYQNGGYYMKDLGSTNGVEFQGQRIDNKQIEEGDVYHLCDYELRFTYR